jgi:Sec-independent protein translocase protein TatA
MNNHLTLIACLAIFVSGCSFMGDVSRAAGGMYIAIGDAFDKEGQRRKAAKEAKAAQAANNSNRSNANQSQKAQSATKNASKENASKNTNGNNTTSGQGTGEIADLGNGQFDISAAGGLSGNRSTTYAKWDRTAKLACKGGKYKIIKREWQSVEYPGILGGIIECASKKL